MQVLISPYVFPGIRNFSKEDTNALIDKYQSKANLFFNNSERRIKGDRRFKCLITNRHFIWYFLNTEYGISYNKLGSVFNRNHSTIRYGCLTVKDRTRLEEEYRNSYNEFKKYLLNFN